MAEKYNKKQGYSKYVVRSTHGKMVPVRVTVTQEVAVAQTYLLLAGRPVPPEMVERLR